MLENHDILNFLSQYCHFVFTFSSVLYTNITGGAFPGCPHDSDTYRGEIQDIRQKTAQTPQERCRCGIQEDAAHVVCFTICTRLL
jgi:hypothetical protein